MRTHLPEAYNGAFCPACKIMANHPENEATLINRIESEYIIECRCGGRYFIFWLNGDLNDGKV